jgi:molecular chaperone GrpE
MSNADLQPGETWVPSDDGREPGPLAPELTAEAAGEHHEGAPAGAAATEADTPGPSSGLTEPMTDLTPPEGAGGLSEVARQRDEYLDALRRLQAEFDNYRKRVDRQHRDTVELAATSLVKKLLPVLDTADLALAHGGGEDVKQLAAALFDTLAKEGLERIDPEGQAFDPEHHEAVDHEPMAGEADDVAPQVSEVLRAGYRWKGRVLRPAMVKVKG